MATRCSIEVDGFSHGEQPIPAACRIGNLLMTGGVHGMNLTNKKIPDDVEQQTVLMFNNLTRILEAAGATLQDVVKMTFYVKVPEARAHINAHWLRAFPDAKSRPARQTFQNDHMLANLKIQCDATAVITDRANV
jgi:2-iminobutanoate/2-iminopropanoate deaminase